MPVSHKLWKACSGAWPAEPCGTFTALHWPRWLVVSAAVHHKLKQSITKTCSLGGLSTLDHLSVTSRLPGTPIQPEIAISLRVYSEINWLLIILRPLALKFPCCTTSVCYSLITGIIFVLLVFNDWSEPLHSNHVTGFIQLCTFYICFPAFARC